jgi:hypothetical protein
VHSRRSLLTGTKPEQVNLTIIAFGLVNDVCVSRTDRKMVLKIQLVRSYLIIFFAISAYYQCCEME